MLIGELPGRMAHNLFLEVSITVMDMLNISLAQSGSIHHVLDWVLIPTYLMLHRFH